MAADASAADTMKSAPQRGNRPREASTPATPVAQLVNIGKRFGATQALDQVSLTITAGTSHALVGRNGAGKSTLVGILTGIQQPDTGQVFINGRPVGDIATRDTGTAVSCVYQHSILVPDLTVAENLLLGAGIGRSRVVRWRQMRRLAGDLLDQWDVAVPATALARDLTVEQRQLVEIARALARGTRLVVLDEPTAQLDRSASGRLFERMRALQAADVTFLFISHHLHEVYDVCQDVTVLRDGRLVASTKVADLPFTALVDAMIGHASTAGATEPQTTVSAPSVEPVRRGGLDEPVLDVRGLTLTGCYTDVTLKVHAGEVVTLAGLTSSGKTELADTIAGLRRPTSGEILMRGESLRLGRPDRAIAAGVGFVPEDRHARGFAAQLSIQENLTVSVADHLGPLGFINRRRQAMLARRLADRLQIVPGDLRAAVHTLSGGNQQKVVMGRAMAARPRLLVLLNPTAGVDVASKRALYSLVQDLVADGAGVLLVTNENDEIALGDRAVVMVNGAVRAEFVRPYSTADLVAAIEGAAVADPVSTLHQLEQP